MVDRLDVDEPPAPDEYGFGSFVLCDGRAIAVVYNSLLVNPDYAGYGPRLSTEDALKSFSPDFLDERGVLLGLAVVGEKTPDGYRQGLPEQILPAGSNVELLETEDLLSFNAPDGKVRVSYLPSLLDQVGEFGIPLVERIIDRIKELGDLDESESRKLDTLARSMKWQRTMDHLRL